MATPGRSSGWKAVTQNRLSGGSTSTTTVRNSSGSSRSSNTPGNGNGSLERQKSSSRGNATKKKDESPLVAPDSTTEPSPKPSRLFLEGEDVFFHTADGQHVLGTVGQVVGETCHVLFGDGTQQWASFKRLKKLSATLDDEDTSKSNREMEQKRKPIAVTPKEETIDIFCIMCGVRKKISVSKARQYKPEGPNVFKCRKCSKLPEPPLTNHRHISPILNKLTQPYKGHSQGPSVISNSLHPGSVKTLLQNQNGITIPTASGSLSIFRQTPAPSIAALGTSNGNTNARSGTLASTNSSKLNQPIAGPSKRKADLCFKCEEDTEPDDRIPCNLCGRFCHLSCLPLTSPAPPKGDKFWDLMCTRCGTQSPDGTKSRSPVFSVRRNISSWSDVAYLILRCMSLERPDQLLFDLETDILQFLEKNMNNLKLPRHYTLPTLEDRKKFIIHALINSRLRFINGKEVKKRASLWALRSEQLEQKLKQESCVQIIDKRDHKAHPQNNTQQRLQSVPNISPPGALKSSRKQPQPTKRVTDVEGGEPPPKKQRDIISVPFGAVPSPPPTSGVIKNNASGSIVNLANFVRTSSAISISNQRSGVESSKVSKDNEAAKRKQNKRPHEISLGTTPEKMRNHSDLVPAHKKPKLSADPSVITKVLAGYFGQQNEKRANSTSPSKKVPGSPSQSQGQRLKIPSLKTHGSSSSSKHQLVEKMEKKKHKHKTAIAERDKPKAIKSAQTIPAPVPQFKAAEEKEIEVDMEEMEFSEESEDEMEMPKKTNKSIKTIKSKLKNMKLKGSPIKAAKLRQRGRPPGVKNLKKAIARSRNGEPKTGGVTARLTKSATSTNGNGVVTKSNGGADERQSRVSKRIVEKNESVVENGDSIANVLTSYSTALLDAVLYGGYRMQCLPPAPPTAAEQRAELAKVYGHFRMEKQNETRSILLGRSETETRSQTRRKSELFGRRTRDLNDFDSYDVVSKKEDAFGVTQYFVIWKGSDDEDEMDNGEDLLDFDALTDDDYQTNPVSGTNGIGPATSTSLTSVQSASTESEPAEVDSLVRTPLPNFASELFNRELPLNINVIKID